MKIDSVQIQNFRGFKNETIYFPDYVCLVGPNGAGKSTVLAALNIFFRQYKDSKTDLSKLSPDDFHHRDVSQPIVITVTFRELSASAKSDLADYVRQDQLTITARADYDPVTQRAEVKQFGSRLGMGEFRSYFEADKAGASAAQLKDIFKKLRENYSGLNQATTKPAMVEALHKFEAENPQVCKLIPSEDQFYGASKGANRLAPHIQWIFVPAAKDITEESAESKNSGLGQLLARTIRTKVNFAEKIAQLRQVVEKEYREILEGEQNILDELSGSLELKLKSWSHPNATAKVLWREDPDKSIKVEEPYAFIRIGERGFESDLARFGHGMQRSYMLTLLQELSAGESEDAPTLVMAIEEPELYQHPPQARYLAELLYDLSQGGAQVIVCSHSPLFIPGDDVESIRVVKESGSPSVSNVAFVTYAQLATALEGAGAKLLKEAGMLAKLYTTLGPTTNEMFFSRICVFVEGIEDIAYISTYFQLAGLHETFRRSHCHLIPLGGKSEIIKPLAIAKLLGIPAFVVIDADTDKTNENEIAKHKSDNKAIISLLGHPENLMWPDADVAKGNLMMWRTNITEAVEADMGTEWKSNFDAACAHYGNAPNLRKNPLAVSRALEMAWGKDVKSNKLLDLVANILEFAKNADGG